MKLGRQTQWDQRLARLQVLREHYAGRCSYERADKAHLAIQRSTSRGLTRCWKRHCARPQPLLDCEALSPRIRGAGLISLKKDTLTGLDWEGRKEAGEFDLTYLHLESNRPAA